MKKCKTLIMLGLTGTFMLSAAANCFAADNQTGEWRSDANGWWIAYPDGSYLTNGWYQSPTSGLWYYMGADGYMLTNATTPDGYYVNADGVLESNQNTSQNTATASADVSMESSGHIYYLGVNSDFLIDISEVLDEGPWTIVDNAICFWQETPQAGEDYLDYMLNRDFLSPASVNKIKHQLMTAYPHTNTVPWQQLF